MLQQNQRQFTMSAMTVATLPQMPGIDRVSSLDKSLSPTQFMFYPEPSAVNPAKPVTTEQSFVRVDEESEEEEEAVREDTKKKARGFFSCNLDYDSLWKKGCVNSSTE